MSKVKAQKSKVDIDIDYVARLANLTLSESESKILEQQLKNILSYISKLQEVETLKVEPIGHITGLENVVREDEAGVAISQEEALRNAPKTHNGLFEVDAIFEEQ